MFAAFATPGSDPFSMLALALALTLLLEFAIQVTAAYTTSAGPRREALAEVPEDEAAPIPAAEPIAPPTAVSSQALFDDDVT